MITKEKFNKYKEVQLSGATNMFNIQVVEILSGLERVDILDIMENYDKYDEDFGAENL